MNGVMESKKKRQIEKEIEFWAIQRDSDKFKYNRATSNFIGRMTILITVVVGLFAIVLSCEPLDYIVGEFKGLKISLQFVIIFISLIFLIFYVLKDVRNYKKSIKKHRINFDIRDEHLSRMYKNLARVDKRKLNKEFEKIKKDYLDGKIKHSLD